MSGLRFDDLNELAAKIREQARAMTVRNDTPYADDARLEHGYRRPEPTAMPGLPEGEQPAALPLARIANSSLTERMRARVARLRRPCSLRTAYALIAVLAFVLGVACMYGAAYLARH